MSWDSSDVQELGVSVDEVNHSKVGPSREGQRPTLNSFMPMMLGTFLVAVVAFRFAIDWESPPAPNENSFVDGLWASMVVAAILFVPQFLALGFYCRGFRGRTLVVLLPTLLLSVGFLLPVPLALVVVVLSTIALWTAAYRHFSGGAFPS